MNPFTAPKLPLTNAERKRKYLEKLKASGAYEIFKKTKAAAEKERRDRINIGLANLPKAVREKTKRQNRAYALKKVQEYRRRKKEEKGLSEEAVHHVPTSEATEKLEGSYKTPSALSKALAKVKRALPSTPTKKKQVVAKLLQSFDTKELQDMTVINKIGCKPTKGIKPDVIDLVKAYYERDDISRMSPNTRDCRNFVDPVTGTKELKQIRYLMYKLSDVYTMFVKYVRNDNDDVHPPVKLSKFCQLRPSHVKLVNSTPLDQCFCFYHSNFMMSCNAIRENLPEFPKYGPELELLILCENPTKDCWLRNCSKCSKVKLEKTLANMLKRSGKNKGKSVVWNQWKKNEEANRFEKCVEPGTLKDLLSYFLEILDEFLKHSYTKRSQAESFEKDNAEVKKSNGKVAVLHIDFAENFCCEAQEEIQLAHWNQASV